MITVFSGDNIVSSRKAFLGALEEAKSKGKETTSLDGKKLSPTDLIQALESKSLFGNDKIIFIENLFSLTKSKDKEKLIEMVRKNSDADTEVFIWEEKELSKTQQEGFNKNFHFLPFKLPAIIFTFLDSLSPGKTKENLQGLHYCLAQEEPEMIFSMLIRQIRLLILAKEGEDYLTGAPWQKTKILKQEKLFTSEKLKGIYQRLLEIDYQQKTSQLPLSLTSSLDLLMVEF